VVRLGPIVEADRIAGTRVFTGTSSRLAKADVADLKVGPDPATHSRESAGVTWLPPPVPVELPVPVEVVVSPPRAAGAAIAAAALPLVLSLGGLDPLEVERHRRSCSSPDWKVNPLNMRCRDGE